MTAPQIRSNSSTPGQTPPERQFAYERLAQDISNQIHSGILRPGDRLPSVRELSKHKKISLTTVQTAYQTLEDKGLIEVRPQSGHYVRLPVARGHLSFNSTLPVGPQPPQDVRLIDLYRQIQQDATRSDLVQFGVALPSPDLLPSARINNITARLARSGRVPSHLLGSPQGTLELRIQISRRAFLAGCNLSPDDLMITNGCTEAISLALRAVCRSGDLVAVESPAYFGILQIIEALGLKVLEIPCHPQEGISLEILEAAIQQYSVRAVVVVSNFSNPLGCCISDENKQRLVKLISEKQIPLIEDDLYGDLSFSDRRPVSLASFDTQGWVLSCSSYSKTISPGYRIGWIVPGKWKNEVEKIKSTTNLFTPLLPQLAIARYLESEGYDHLLRRTRRCYALNIDKMTGAILRSFPTGTRVTTPQGGYVLWIQMPETVDSLELYRRAIALGITIAPGYLFASDRRYASFIRLNAAMLSDGTAWAVARLGEIVHDMEKGRPSGKYTSKKDPFS
jgi:DNA-binding transcriptional MocR family regulator